MDSQKLKKNLDRLYETYDRSFLSSDPLWFVHEFTGDGDREVVALIASSLAYGRVETIKKAVSAVLSEMGGEPSGFTMAFDPKRRKRAFSGFVHRFNRAEDIRCLVYFARQMISEAGSIGGFFMRGCGAADGVCMKEALASFSKRTLGLKSGGIYGTKGLPAGAGVRFFFPSPTDGSPCKRLNLFLRWMVRRADGLDLGMWDFIEPSSLIIPLDTHVARISRLLGLTQRSSPGWAMAEEITGELKKLDPADPVKYDFAISRLGILEECRRQKDPAKCKSCIVKNICVIR